VFRFPSPEPECDFPGEVNAQQRLEDFSDLAYCGLYMRFVDRLGLYRLGFDRFLNQVALKLVRTPRQ
jgi:hypothetical protein